MLAGELLPMMITIATFSLDLPVAHDELIARFEKSAPRYL